MLAQAFSCQKLRRTASSVQKQSMERSMDICLVVCYISAAHLRGLSRWKRGRTTNLSVDTVSEVAMNGFSSHGMAWRPRTEANGCKETCAWQWARLRSHCFWTARLRFSQSAAYRTSPPAFRTIFYDECCRLPDLAPSSKPIDLTRRTCSTVRGSDFILYGMGLDSLSTSSH